MTDKVIIRKAVVEDAEQLILHTQKVLEENSSFMGTSLEEYHVSLEQERAWIESHEGKGLVLVAKVNHEIIGLISFRLSDKKKFSHKGILGMSIREEYTNQGLGKTLIGELLQWARENPKVEKVTLEVFSNNERAIHLYKKMGFIEEGRKVKAAKLGPNEYVDDIIMSLFV